MAEQNSGTQRHTEDPSAHKRHTGRRRNRGQLVQRSGSWLLRVYVGRAEDGKRRYVSQTCRGSRADACRQLMKLLREVDSQSAVLPSRETLAAFLHRWLTTKVDIAARTHWDYERLLALYIVPTLGGTRLQDVTPLAIGSLYAWLSKERGLSPRTVRYVHSVLHHALRRAVDWGLLPRNPADHPTLPRSTRRPPSILDGEQIAALLRRTGDDSLGALWAVLLTTGLRPGEALALKWSDLQGADLHVRRTLAGNGRGSFVIAEAEAKTRESIRSVTLPASTVAALEAHRRRQAAEILAAGHAYKRADLMFASAAGTPLDHNRVRRVWKKTVRDAGLPPVRLYDARHSHATALLSSGVNLAWVSDRLGHTDIQLTKRVYAHVLPEAHREMAVVMERIVSSNL